MSDVRERFMWGPDDIVLVDSSPKDMLTQLQAVITVEEAKAILPVAKTFIETATDVLMVSRVKKELVRVEALAGA